MSDYSLSDFYDPSKVKNIKPVKCIVIGGGNRGFGYSQYAKHFPHLLNVVGIADPKPQVREKFIKLFKLQKNQAFKDWKEFMKLDKLADFAMICTPDIYHKEPAIAMANKGYHILLEKPMATSQEDCKAIVEACEANKVMINVCHVLRYYPPNLKIKELISNGAVGDVVNIQHLEPVGFYHFAHSYVRGNWRNESESCFSLLAKCCHDIDLICYWMGSSCISVSSFGSLNHFKKENKPPGGGSRCVDCKVEENCCYSALKIYGNPAKSGHFGWPVSVVTDVEDLSSLMKNLRTGPYGRCVYECDNDVCDNQVVNMVFEGGKTSTLTMIAFSQKLCQRETKVFGTKGQITYTDGHQVSCFDFLSRKTTVYNCNPSEFSLLMRGHSGADFHMIDAFIKAVMFKDPSYIKTDARDALYSHQVVFAAERSRIEGKTMHANENWIM